MNDKNAAVAIRRQTTAAVSKTGHSMAMTTNNIANARARTNVSIKLDHNVSIFIWLVE